MKKTKIFLAIALCFSYLNFSSAFAQQSGASIEAELNKTLKSLGGCSKAKMKLRSLKRQYKDVHFAFAARSDNTITGIRGCGYAWRADKSAAEARAMFHCKKSEMKYGTDNGKKVCKILPL